MRNAYKSNKRNSLTLVWLALLLIAAMLVGGCGVEAKQTGNLTNTEPQGRRTHPPFVSLENLNIILSQPMKPIETAGLFRAVVLPHHLVAGAMAGAVLQALQGQQPSLLVIVGPNHTNQGGRIITGLADWQTPHGQVPTHRAAAEALVKGGLAVEDEDFLDQEHSIGAVVSLVGRFLPGIPVVPLALHRDVSLQEVDALREALSPWLEQGGVVVASVDFSHYLRYAEARERDAVTLKAMQDFEYNTLYHLDNDHLDSPASLSMALREAQGPDRSLRVLDHSNSALILKNDTLETTSYFTLGVVEE